MNKVSIWIFLICFLGSWNVKNLSYSVKQVDKIINCRSIEVFEQVNETHLLSRYTTSEEAPVLTNINILSNITKVLLTDNYDQKNSDNFLFLNNFPKLKELKMDKYKELNSFNWSHVPEKVEILNIRNNGQALLLSDESCEGWSNLNVRMLWIQQHVMNDFPKCLPQNLKTLVLKPYNYFEPENSLPNKTFENFNETYEWPTTFKFLYVDNFGFRRFPANFFQKARANFTRLWLKDCRNGLEPQFEIYPDTLQGLKVENCSFSSRVETGRFKGLRLLLLKLNKIEHVPHDAPESLQRLDLEYNRIRLVHRELERLTNLTNLNLAHNRLALWPDHLPANLENLDLGHNGIEFIPGGALERFEVLREFNIRDNRLLNFPDAIPTSLVTMNLDRNRIENVDSMYENAENLILLYINLNPLSCDVNLFNFIVDMLDKKVEVLMDGFCRPFLTELAKGQIKQRYEDLLRFEKEKNCDYNLLDVECKGISKLPVLPVHFSLKQVYIEDGDIAQVPDNYYISQRQIRDFTIINNKLKRIPYGLPYQHIENIKLLDNKITTLTKRNMFDLVKMEKLIYLNLKNNQIVFVDPYFFHRMVNFKYLILPGNKLDCSCSNYFFVSWFNKKFIHDPLSVLTENPVCESPERNVGRRINSLGEGFFRYECFTMCDVTFDSLVCSRVEYSWFPYNITTVVREITPALARTLDSKKLQITNSGWGSADVKLLGQLRLSHVNFSGNNLTEFPINLISKHTEAVDLSNNQIEALPKAELLKEFTQLNAINLNNNLIKLFGPAEVAVFSMVQTVSLEGNPLSCDCDQQSMMIWIEANRNKLGNENRKFGYGLETMKCSTPEKLKGSLLLTRASGRFSENCPLPYKSSTSLLLIIAASVVFAVLVVSVLLNVYITKQRKKKNFSNIAKAFKSLVEKEEVETLIGSEGKYKYDAFISYANQDKKFVYAFVEEMESVRRRKICFHERDFPAGENITTNIINSIRDSSVVILVISTDFEASPWCRYEVQVALTTMHKRGKPLVPILLNNVENSKNFNGNVETILKDITTVSCQKEIVPDSTDDSEDKQWQSFCDKIEDLLPKHD